MGLTKQVHGLFGIPLGNHSSNDHESQTGRMDEPTCIVLTHGSPGKTGDYDHYQKKEGVDDQAVTFASVTVYAKRGPNGKGGDNQCHPVNENLHQGFHLRFLSNERLTRLDMLPAVLALEITRPGVGCKRRFLEAMCKKNLNIFDKFWCENESLSLACTF